MSVSLLRLSCAALTACLTLLAGCGGRADAEPGVASVMQVRSAPAAVAATDSAVAAQEVSRLYVALFGRAPDSEGLNYWAGRLHAGESMAQLADAMYGVAPARAYYPSGAAPRQVVASFYRNVLGREADSGGLEHWTTKLSLPGTTAGSVMAEMIAVVVSYAGNNPDGIRSARFFANRVAVAAYFASKLGTAGSSATEAVASVDDTADSVSRATAWIDARTPLVAASPVGLVDIKPRYLQLCGARANMQHVIPIDLNGDGRLDLLMNLWCASPMGQPNTGPVPNTLVALVQGENFSFEDRTREVFGTDIVDIGGVGIRYVREDFNADGLDDVVFAVNMEDHRLGSNTLVQNTAIMSRGGGRYEVQRIGSPAFSQGLTLKDNELGRRDVVLMPANEAMRFSGSWKIVATHDWIGWVETLFLPRSAPGRGSEMAFAQGTASTDYFFYQFESGRWVQRGSFVMDGRYVPFRSYTGDVGQTKLFSLDGKDFAIGGFLESCLIRMAAAASPTMLTILVGKEIVGGYRGGMLNENAGYPDMTKMMRFGLDASGIFGRVPISISNEVTGISPHRMVCDDIDGDGHQDAIVYRWRPGEPPLAYLNDRSGGLARVADGAFPTPPGSGAGQLYVDLDGDGIRDLLYYPITGAWPDFSSVRLLVHRGRRALNMFDTGSK